jgi:PAS domain S-box-containing protein
MSDVARSPHRPRPVASRGSAGAGDLSTLLDRAVDVVFRYRLRPTPRLEYVNAAVVRLTGFTRREHYADPTLVLAVIHPDDRPLLSDLLARGPAAARAVFRIVHRDGHLVWVEQRAGSILGADGQVVAVEGIAREIADPTTRSQASIRVLGDLRIDLDRGRVAVGGETVHLTPSEFRVLVLLTERRGQIVSREMIMEALWDSRHVGNGRTGETHVSKLRRKIGDDARRPTRIETVRGEGYRFNVG